MHLSNKVRNIVRVLKSIKIDKEWNEQAARKQLLEFFSSAGIEAKETINARKKLATLLFS